MLNVVLVEPEIPPNTGNIMRLCANTGVRLHLVEPLGFPIDHAKMRRAGLDYREFASVRVHAEWSAFLKTENPVPNRMFAITTKGTTPLQKVVWSCDDWIIFGSETKGLGPARLAEFGPDQRVRIPMRPDNRSLNLSNAVAIVVYEAWRQFGYEGAV